MKISFFCSASDKLAPVFYSEANLVGRSLAKYKLIFGGSDLGLMGVVAGEAIKAGGTVKGIITKNLDQKESKPEGLSELVICETLAERKQKLIDEGEVILVLPGGIGTLDECVGALAAKQLGEHDKPIIIYNCYDYWSGFLEYLELLFEQRMILQNLNDLYTVVNTVEKLNEVLGSLSKK